MFVHTKRMIITALAALTVVTSCVHPIYAADEFDGWTDENEDNAWTVYETTDWSKMQVDLTLDQLRPQAKADVPEYFREQEEPAIRQALKNIDAGRYESGEYVELMLAMAKVLVNGHSDKDPAAVNIYFNPDMEISGKIQSYEILATRLFKSEHAHESQPSQADILRQDDALMTVVQGVMYGTSYSATTDLFSSEGSEAYYAEHKEEFEKLGIKQMKTQFAVEVSEIYSTSSISNGGYITYSGKVTETMLRIVEAARGDFAGNATANQCWDWAGDTYGAIGLDWKIHGIGAYQAWQDRLSKDVKWSTDINTIPPGAFVFGTGRGSNLGGSVYYGHVGIYLGDGTIADNIGGVDISSVNEWISWQTDVIDGQQGWLGWVYPISEDIE